MNKKLKIQLISIAILILSISCSLFVPGPASTFKEFLRTVEAGKTEEAISMLSSRTINTLGVEKWREFLNERHRKLSEVGGYQSITIVEENIVGETATITAKVVFGNGSEVLESVELIKEDKKWKIDISPSLK
jgi:hypothetical protein